MPVKIDKRCACGWEFPTSVVPVRLSGANRGGGAIEDHIQPDTFVALRCPRCDKGHAFYMPHVAAKAGGEAGDLTRKGTP